MSSKCFVIVCVLAVIVQTISAQVLAFPPGMLANSLAAIEAAAVPGAYGPGLAPLGPGLAPIGAGLAPVGAGLAPLAPGLAPLAPVPAVACVEALVPEVLPVLPACEFGLSLADLAANGGSFAVTSSSPIAPNGVKVQSENLLFEGPLAVQGQLPFLGAVALEGPLPAVGQGAVAYGCGDGNVGILTEGLPGIANGGMPGPMGPNPMMAGYNGPRGPYGPML